MRIESSHRSEKQAFRGYDPEKSRHEGADGGYSNADSYGMPHRQDYKHESRSKNFWDRRPTENDYPYRSRIIKIVVGLFINAFFILSGYYLHFPASLNVMIIVINTVLYYLAQFSGKMKVYSTKSLGALREIKLYDNRYFFFNDEDRDSMFVLDRTDRNIIGLFTLKVERVPVNVGANVSAVIRALNQHNIPFTYQFHYGPRVENKGFHDKLDNLDIYEVKKMYRKGQIKPKALTNFIISNINGSRKQMEISLDDFDSKPHSKSCPNSEDVNDYDLTVTFTFFSERRYFLDINASIEELEAELRATYSAIQMLFLQDFSHYELVKLRGQELIDQMHIRYKSHVEEFRADIDGLGMGLGEEQPNGGEHNAKTITNTKKASGFQQARESGFLDKVSYHKLSFRTIYVASYIACLIILLSVFFYNAFLDTREAVNIIIVLSIIGASTIILLILSDYFSGISFFNQNLLERTFLDMNSNVRYYQYTAFPDVIFMHLIDFDIVFAMDEWVVNELPSYLHVDFQKFLRGILRSEERFPLNMSLMVRPCTTEYFAKHYFQSANSYVQRQMLSDENIDPDRIKKQFMYVGGMCNISLFFETYSYRVATEITPGICEELARKLNDYSINVENGIRSYVLYGEFHDIQQLTPTVNAFLAHSIKSHQFFPHGTSTNFPLIPVSGKKVSSLIDLRGIIKRGVTPQLPVEFITPSNIPTNIYFANLYNTEINRMDAKTGLLYQNFFEGILVAGESSNALNLWNLSIILNSLKREIPFIVFDHSGSYISLLSTLKKSKWKSDILVLKLGENYSMNIMRPETPARTNDDQYIEELVDCFSISYNLTAIESSLLRTMFFDLLSDGLENLELAQISSNFERYAPKFGNRTIETVRTVFMGLTKSANITAFRTATEYMPHFGDIIYSDKSYIFDLSDLGIQERFLAQTVILLKLKNYLNAYWEIDPKKLSTRFKSMADFNGEYENASESFDYSEYEELTRPRSKVIALKEPVSVLERNFNIKLPVSEKFAPLLKGLQKYDYGLLIRTEKPGKIRSYITEICQNFIGLKVTNYDNQQAFRTLFHLDETNGEGYSERRHQSYQQSFLTKLPDYLAIIKRKDVDFPYPVMLDLLFGLTLRKPTHNEIKTHMKGLGYDIDFAYELLESKASLTTLEKDFESHRRVISHIIRYMEHMEEMAAVSDVNITKQRCLRELKQFLQEPLLEQLGNNRAATAARKGILSLIINHGYLVQGYDSGVDGTSNSRPFLKPQPKIREAIDEYHNKSKVFETTYTKTIIDDDQEFEETADLDDNDIDETPFQRMYNSLVRDKVLGDEI